MSAPPPARLALAVAQLDPTVGDVAGNLAKARRARAEAARLGAEVVAFTELFLAGYPPEDLVLKPAFQSACASALRDLAADTADGGPAVLIGLPWADEDGLHNTYAHLDGGRLQALRHKSNLPNYGVFDEKRVFNPGPLPGPVLVRGVRLGLPICEDIWGTEVVECLAETGAEALVVPNGSPYWRGKRDERLGIAVARAAESGLPLLYANQVGGQDELVFDGGSFAVDADGALRAQLPALREAVARVDLVRDGDRWRFEGGPMALPEEGDEADYAACVLGLRAYVGKCGFPGVLLGLSGGIDSALCAAMAVDALGPDRVHAVMLPYRYTAPASIRDAAEIAARLGIRYDTVPIAPAVEALEGMLAPLFAGTARGVTEENLQSRVRGTTLMALSNKFGAMVMSTGNKSEMAVGYATLYGDMNGGYNPIKDLYKTAVFRLSRLRNTWRPEGALGPAGEVIPPYVIARPPSAELAERQTDQDSLPPYPVLDDILERLVEDEASVAELVAGGHDPDLVRRIERLLYLAEYKRRQAPPGPKVTRRNFGRDRRYPLVNRFRDEGHPGTTHAIEAPAPTRARVEA